ncbi:replication protein [Pseudobacillus sp. 179-B 2D1 NHS]|uniref:replication protein n=1 Tax=Pseudobacillus sp. 179-B 2D1 NHS TaxID=3374292 RepID=UPI00387983D6
MADVQLENGYTKIANELLDAIQQFQFTQNQFKLLMALWRHTYGWNRKECEFSLSFIESVTYLDRKRVNETLKALIQNNVIQEVESGSARKTKVVRFNKNYDEWTIKRYKSSGVLPTSSQSATSGEITTSSSGVMTTSGSGQSATHKRNIKKNIKYIAAANNACEEPTGGVPTTEIVQLPNGSVGQIPGNSSNAYQQIRDRYMELAGIGGFDVNPKDREYIKELLSYDIDIEKALSWLEECFADFKPKHSRDKINSFGYCLPKILDKHFAEKEADKNGQKVYQYRRSYGRSTGKGKSVEQAYRELEEARRAWGG